MQIWKEARSRMGWQTSVCEPNGVHLLAFMKLPLRTAMSIYLHVIDWCFPSVKTETGWSLKLKCLLSDLLQKIICSPLVFGLSN